MHNALIYAIMISGFLLSLFFFIFAWTSHREGEKRACWIAVLIAFMSITLSALATFLPFVAQQILLLAVAALGVVTLVLLLLPIGHVKMGKDPQSRFDERDIPFARIRLIPGSPEYQDYYSMRPELRSFDEKTRAFPGLLSLDALKAHPLVFRTADASFSITEALREEVDGPVAPTQTAYPPETNTAYLKALTRHLGAVSVGVAELQPSHLYSHVGCGSGGYGSPIHLDHRYALALAVEMDHRAMAAAPEAQVVMESARQYVEAAKIALTLGTLIRSMGYSARAHIDGNYRVVAPLVARDAGLGEIGRMGILITPQYGPRVRLAVVTTNLPLIPDQPTRDRTVLDFCRFCKKCAENCPSRSIPFDDRQEIEGALRWRINPDTCFRYWNVIGSDCGLCMSVCPYSHPDHWTHNLVRWAVRRSGFARRVALWMDDVFYGRKPSRGRVYEWIP